MRRGYTHLVDLGSRNVRDLADDTVLLSLPQPIHGATTFVCCQEAPSKATIAAAAALALACGGVDRTLRN